ncbi:hypothetical protein [Nocardia abscessus]|uniref:hypothetical protein n=1 Tax=Nocardia abscessus TaxID=120957 RepID=UPI00245665CC|nr:hypothetical protein [Nocardia abscessus]
MTSDEGTAASAWLAHALAEWWETSPEGREHRREFMTLMVRAIVHNVSANDLYGPLPEVHGDVLKGIAATFARVIARQHGRPGWIPDDVDLIFPTRVYGIVERLRGYRFRSPDAVAHTIAHLRALLLHRRRRPSEPPGRMVTMRGHLTRGPNTRSSTPFPVELRDALAQN